MKKEIICEFSKEDSDDCKRADLCGKKIVLYENDRRHCYKRHYNDFDDPKDFSFVMKNLDYVIAERDFVLYNSKNNSLEYYKKLSQNVSVRIKVDNSNELKIKTVFVVPNIKYENKLSKAMREKYIINQ